MFVYTSEQGVYLLLYLTICFTRRCKRLSWFVSQECDKGIAMDAIIGRYRMCVSEDGLVVKHAAGICFDFTPEEALRLLDFIGVYRDALLARQQQDGPETEPRLESVIVAKEQEDCL
jgi:hypothetical protein